MLVFIFTEMLFVLYFRLEVGEGAISNFKLKLLLCIEDTNSPEKKTLVSFTIFFSKM